MTDPTVTLRAVVAEDLPIFFEQGRDPEANAMAAFTSKDPNDRSAFDAHWAKIRGLPTVTLRTILVEDRVAGHLASFLRDGEPEVTYWLGREFWGRGIATRALAAFLQVVETRPLHARVVTDNVGSVRVLEKCGFTITGSDEGFANARGCVVAEHLLTLE